MTGEPPVDVVIIGGGLEGLSVAWALTRRGTTNVVVLERETVGSGFTAKSSGIIRCHYGVRSIAAMSLRSLPVFEAAPEILGTDIGYRRTGYVVAVGEENVAPLEANVEMQQALGIEVELIDEADARTLLPHLRFDDCAAFAYEPRGAFADAYQTAQGFAHLARAGGARVRQSSPVAAITATGDRVRGVQLASGERITADVVIVATGPWAPALVAPLGIELPIRALREQLLIVDPGVPTDSLPVLSDLVSLQYLRPEGRGHMLLGNSDHQAPEYADPDRYSNVLDDHHLVGAIEKFGHRFPDLVDVSLVASYAGCYDVTPDFNPVIGRSPVDGLYLCTGFSGHGFKISPAVGDLMAEIVLGRSSSDPAVTASDFAFERFEAGPLLTSPHPYIGAGEMR